jgi:hypothetical protein
VASGPLTRRPGWALASVLLASVCAIVLTAPSAHAAQEEEGIALGDIRPLTMTWNEARRNEGVASTLCNVSDRRAEGLDPRLEGFKFTRGDKPVRGKVLQLLDGDLRVLARSPKLRAGLGPGGCLAIIVRVIPGTPIVDAGPFTGVLAVSSAGSGLARRELSLAGGGKAETVAAKTAPKAPSLDATRKLPWLDAELNDPPDLALLGKVPPSAIAGTCGEESEKGAAGADEDEKCPRVGVLVKDQHRAHLRIDGALIDKVEEQGVTLLPLNLEKAAQVGTYEGVLDLGGTGAEADAVAVTIKVTDAWWCALIALAIGFGLALSAQLRFRRFRPARQLRKAADRLRSEYAQAKQQFDAHLGEHDKLKAFRQPATGADAYAGDVKSALRAYGKSSVYLDRDSETWKKLKTSLEEGRTDIACWKDEDGLAKSLVDLRTELTKLRDLVAARRFHDQSPALAGSAAKLLNPPQVELNVGEAIERAKQATGFIPLLKRWQELAEQLLRYQVWWHRLRARADEMPDADRATLFQAGAKLVVAKGELMKLNDAEALERLQTERDLALAEEELTYLGLRWSAPMPDSDASFDLTVESAGVAPDPALSALWPATGEIEAVEQLIRTSADWIVDAARALTVRETWGRFFDVFWILLSLAAGGITALAAFYIDKEFGTVFDYLTVVVVGVAAQALLNTVVESVDQVLGSRAPILESDPQPAQSAPAQ